jgi:hypothetical protein
MQGKLEDKEILCFQLNFPVSQGNLEDKSVCMGNEENTWLNVPVETKETESSIQKEKLPNFTTFVSKNYQNWGKNQKLHIKNDQQCRETYFKQDVKLGIFPCFFALLQWAEPKLCHRVTWALFIYCVNQFLPFLRHPHAGYSQVPDFSGVLLLTMLMPIFW